MFNKDAKWIWINDNPQDNEYAVFEERFVFSFCHYYLSFNRVQYHS